MSNAARIIKQGVRSGLHTVLGAKPRYVNAPVLFGPARGIRMSFRLSPDGEFEFVLGRYEPKVAKKLKELCRPGSVVWECGSHIGYFTSLLARLIGPKGRLVVFEPDPSNRARTAANLELNAFKNFEIVPVAVGEDQKNLMFVSNRGAASRLEHAYVGQTKKDVVTGDILVDSVALDTVLGSGKYPVPQILKMDIEGAELWALPRAERLISTARPLVFIESHNPQTDKMIWDTFTRHRYQLIRVPTGKTATRVEDVFGQLVALPR